jgi:hypothetical protein
MTTGGAQPISPDLSLRLRLDALRKSLEQIRSLDKSIRTRRNEVGTLHAARRDIKSELTPLKVSIDSAATYLKEVESAADDGTIRTVMRFLDDASTAEARLEKLFGSMATVIDQMANLWDEISAEGLNSVNDALSKKCRQRITRVEQMEREIEDDPERDRGAVWEDYEDIAFRDGARLFGSEPLFAEYVDFLGGLALRNTGIDEGVCHMADELLERCHLIADSTLWHSLTVPARRMPPESTIARMIRLGFPEWTVWAVPLGVYEYGHVVVTENRELRDQVKESALEEHLDALRIYLADAFATYCMGPSYAYASILLALDPYSGEYVGRPEGTAVPERQPASMELSPDTRRAYVILEALRDMDSGAYKGVRTTLTRYWENALQAFGLDFKLEDDEERRLKEVVRLMSDFLDVHTIGLRYEADQWRKVTSDAWPKLVETPPAEFPLKTLDDDIRDVVNAAWHQRILDPESAVGDGADRLAEAALALWRERLSAKQSTSGVSARSVGTRV